MTTPIINHTAKVFGYLKNIDGSPLVATAVRIIISPSPQYIKDILFDRTCLELLTNEEGYFEKTLLGGLNITVVIPSTKFQVSGTVPLTGEINIINLDKQYWSFKLLCNF